MSIATLIPAYKTKYIAELLTAVSNQTYQPSIVIISDDSPGGEFRKKLQTPEMQQISQHLNIQVHEGPRVGSGYDNMKNLLKIWKESTFLFHVLLDDDIIYPEFYERHVQAHLLEGYSCTISKRWSSNEAGFPTQTQPVPESIKNKLERIVTIDSDELFALTVGDGKNWLGEFSNTVIRKELASTLFKPEMGGISYAGLWDLGFFLDASLQAPIGYLQEPLGYFRQNEQSNSADKYNKFMKSAFLAYAALAAGGQVIGKLTPQQAQSLYRNLANFVTFHYSGEAEIQPILQLLPQMANGDIAALSQFREEWSKLLKLYKFN